MKLTNAAGDVLCRFCRWCQRLEDSVPRCYSYWGSRRSKCEIRLDDGDPCDDSTLCHESEIREREQW